MKLSFLVYASTAFLALAEGASTPQWELAPFMDQPPPLSNGIPDNVTGSSPNATDHFFFANHCVGLTVNGNTVLNTGILRIPEFDVGCGEGCITREDFSDYYGKPSVCIGLEQCLSSSHTCSLDSFLHCRERIRVSWSQSFRRHERIIQYNEEYE